MTSKVNLVDAIKLLQEQKKSLYSEYCRETEKLSKAYDEQSKKIDEVVKQLMNLNEVCLECKGTGRTHIYDDMYDDRGHTGQCPVCSGTGKANVL